MTKTEEGEKGDGGSSRWLKVGGVVALISLAIEGAFVLPLSTWVSQLIDWMQAAGPTGAIAYAVVYILAAILMLPASILTAGAGLAYGPLWGTFLVSPVSVLAATLAFLLGRTIARGWITKRTSNDPKFRAVDAAIGKQGLKIVLLLRLSPVFPFNLLNYALGVTGVSLRDYVLGSFVGMLPGTILYVYLGSVVGNLSGVAHGASQGSAARTALSVAGLLATVAVTIFITRVARRALAAELETSPSSDAKADPVAKALPIKPPSESLLQPNDTHNQTLIERVQKAQRSVVLLGAGHTHLHVLREWRSHGPQSGALTCVSNFETAAYSGMLSGVLAGDYPEQAMNIDVRSLCARVGATLLVGDVTAVQLHDRQLILADGRSVDFDFLSIGVGSVPRTEGVQMERSACVVAVKPMQTFLARLRDACTRRQPAEGPLRVVIVGGGAAGVEVALCLPAFVEAVVGSPSSFRGTLVGSTPILHDSSEGLARRGRAALDHAGIKRLVGRVVAVEDRVVRLENGSEVEADIVVWVTGASAPPLLQAVDLPKDREGFLLTTDALCSTGSQSVFAVGDAGAIEGHRIAKAGVYAVREGPVLLENLRRALAGLPLQSFSPQSSFLKLLNTGGGKAIGEWRGVSFEGAWCHWLKDAIDRRFVARYQTQ
ncbi:MAG: VTT domain-containing protein [Vicinamibacteria bacterium]